MITSYLPDYHDRAVEVLVRGFWEYPESVHLLADPGARARGLPRFMASVLCDAAPFGEVELAHDHGALTGVAIWLPPAATPPSGRRLAAHAARLLPIVAVAPGAVSEALRSQMAARRHQDSSPYRLLAFLAVDPAERRRGIGSELVRSGLERGRADGVRAVLSTSDPTNVAWYERFGFTVSEEVRLTRRWPKIWRMQRGWTAS